MARLVRLGEKKPENFLPRRDAEPPPAPRPGGREAAGGAPRARAEAGRAAPQGAPGAGPQRDAGPGQQAGRQDPDPTFARAPGPRSGAGGSDRLASVLAQMKREQALSGPVYGDPDGDPLGDSSEGSAGDVYLGAGPARPARVLHRSPPRSPSSERVHLQATVVLYIERARRGRVRYAFERRSGNAAFDSALERAVRAARIPPPPRRAPAAVPHRGTGRDCPPQERLREATRATSPARPLALALPLLLAPSLARAQRAYIDVGSPNFQPLPIAVAPFQADEASAADATEMATVVRNDLALSGLFDVLDPKGFLADAGEGLLPSGIKFGRWTDVGAEGLVKAEVRRSGEDSSGEFHLYEVRAGRERALGQPAHPGRRAAGWPTARRRGGASTTRASRASSAPASLALRKLAKGRELVVYDVDGKRGRRSLFRDEHHPPARLATRRPGDGLSPATAAAGPSCGCWTSPAGAPSACWRWGT